MNRLFHLTRYFVVTILFLLGLAACGSGLPGDTTGKLMAGAMQGIPLMLSANVTTFAGTSGSAALPVSGVAVGANARFNFPQGMATDGKYLYVADYQNNGIQRIDPATQEVILFAGSPAGTGGSANATGTAAQFFRPYDITSDGTSLFVTEFNGCMIRKIDIATAAVTTFAGQSGICVNADGTGTAATFANPKGITTDNKDLYVTDGVRVRKINIATQAVSTFAGSGAVGHVDATGTAASFNNLEGITTDGTSLFVVDWYYSDIRKIDIATATVSSLAGDYTVANSTTSNDGTGILATFNKPVGITSDGSNLYVVEFGGDVVRKAVISSAVVTTIAGTATLTGTTDAVGAAARFNSPQGITVYNGNLYIGDRGNSSIRRIQ